MPRYTPVKLAYKVAVPKSGANEKPPIIFNHGLSGSNEHWDGLTQIFADRTKRKVYAPDARNHGDSEWTDVFNFDCNVDDLLHFMDSEKMPKAIIVGHSMGGITVIKTALRAPDRIEKLIVEDMSVENSPEEVMGQLSMMFALLKKALQTLPKDVDEATAFQIIYDFVLSQMPEEMKTLVKPESLEKKIQFRRLEDGRLTYKANFDVLEKSIGVDVDFEKIEGVYKGPALFLYGKQSVYYAHLNEPSVTKHFPNAEITTVENAGHGIHYDQPEEFTETVVNFILKE